MGTLATISDNAVVPIDDRNRQAIELAIAEIQYNLETSKSARAVKAFTRMSGVWTCRAKPAALRFEQLDWHNYVVSDKDVSLIVKITETTFGMMISGDAVMSRRYEDKPIKLRFRVDGGPVKALDAISSGSPRDIVDILQDDAIALCQHMLGGRRIAIQADIPGVGLVTDNWDITGFEYANYDALKRFVFANG